MFAGSLQGVTQTLSLAIYQEFDVDFETALAIGALLVVGSALVLFCREGDPRVETLHVDLDHALRSFRLSLGSTSRPRRSRSSGPRAGKTSVLRAIAASCGPSAAGSRSATTWLDTASRVDLPPERRRVGLVFQEYALFPHLTVRANVAFGGRDRVDELLERFGIAGSRTPAGAISGGERQRVALARALARDPGVLLLDEPLSALDAHTRRRVRTELREVLGDLGLPTLIVTHDFEDATSLADASACSSTGACCRSGAPRSSSPRLRTRSSPGHGRSPPRRRLGVCERAHRGGARRGVHRVLGRRGEGRVALAVYPWEVSVARDAPDDSAVNHLRAPIASIVTIGNRVASASGR